MKAKFYLVSFIKDDIPLAMRQKVYKQDTFKKEKINGNLHKAPNVEEGNRDEELSVAI